MTASVCQLPALTALATPGRTTRLTTGLLFRETDISQHLLQMFHIQVLRRRLVLSNSRYHTGAVGLATLGRMAWRACQIPSALAANC